jgi:hypothetical protein
MYGLKAVPFKSLGSQQPAKLPGKDINTYDGGEIQPYWLTKSSIVIENSGNGVVSKNVP